MDLFAIGLGTRHAHTAAKISTSRIAVSFAQDDEPASDQTLVDAGRAAADMAATVIERGAQLDDDSATSLVSVSVKEEKRSRRCRRSRLRHSLHRHVGVLLTQRDSVRCTFCTISGSFV